MVILSKIWILSKFHSLIKTLVLNSSTRYLSHGYNLKQLRYIKNLNGYEIHLKINANKRNKIEFKLFIFTIKWHAKSTLEIVQLIIRIIPLYTTFITRTAFSATIVWFTRIPQLLGNICSIWPFENCWNSCI